MKRFAVLFSVVFFLILLANAFAQLKITQGSELFIKPESENLRFSPNGSIICQLPQGARVIALGEDGNWVAVQIVGYIWKGSLSDSREKIEGYSIKVLHILVNTEAEAKEIKELLSKGSDFKQLAKARSKGPNAEKGGDLGAVNKGDLMPELDNTLRNLKAGQTSDIVKSKMGYHIFRRYE